MQKIDTNLPEMTFVANGEIFKTLKITAKAGMHMPLHHSTEEVVIVVLNGEAILSMTEREHSLAQDSTFIIPANIPHSLIVISDFQAIAIMVNQSEIIFGS